MRGLNLLFAMWIYVIYALNQGIAKDVLDRLVAMPLFPKAALSTEGRGAATPDHALGCCIRLSASSGTTNSPRTSSFNKGLSGLNRREWPIYS
eukprot:3235146-Heterocapsa_arctica.AAC.1